jgi:dTDP-4-amino-4,6-dideoxygalactose transaminase
VCGRKTGTFGTAAAFSMNGPKPLSAGEGGFLLTDDDEVYYRALLHGHYNKRCRSELPAGHPLAAYAVTGMGLKHRIHPLAAAIALEQLPRLDDYLAGRDQIAGYMRGQLQDMPGISVQALPPGTRSSWYGLTLRYQPGQLGGLPTARFHQALLAEGCHEADRPGSTCPLNLLALFQKPGPLMPQYEGVFSYAEGDFPAAEALHRNTIKLPVWHHKDDMQLVDQYLNAFRKVTSSYRALLG